MCNRAVTKERHKFLSVSQRNKACQACVLCKSLSLCPQCQRCPSCCRKSTCGRPSLTFLAGLALSGFKSKGSVHTKGRVFPALQSKTTSVKVTGDNQSLCRSGQEQAPQRILTGTNPKTGGRKGHGPFFSGFLQPVISGSKAQQQMEAHPRPQSIELVPSVSLLQDGNPETIRLSLQKGELITSLDFSDAYFHIPISPRSRKYLRFHFNGQTYQFTVLPFGLSTVPLEFTKVVKEVKLMAQSQGIRIHQYLDDWLVRAPCQAMCQRHTRILLDLCRKLGWVVNMSKSELCP